jgi:hypothetical protein
MLTASDALASGCPRCILTNRKLVPNPTRETRIAIRPATWRKMDVHPSRMESEVMESVNVRDETLEGD